MQSRRLAHAQPFEVLECGVEVGLPRRSLADVVQPLDEDGAGVLVRLDALLPHLQHQTPRLVQTLRTHRSVDHRVVGNVVGLQTGAFGCAECLECAVEVALLRVPLAEDVEAHDVRQQGLTLLTHLDGFVDECFGDLQLAGADTRAEDTVEDEAVGLHAAIQHLTQHLQRGPCVVFLGVCAYECGVGLHGGELVLLEGGEEHLHLDRVVALERKVDQTPEHGCVGFDVLLLHEVVEAERLVVHLLGREDLHQRLEEPKRTRHTVRLHGLYDLLVEVLVASVSRKRHQTHIHALVVPHIGVIPLTHKPPIHAIGTPVARLAQVHDRLRHLPSHLAPVTGSTGGLALVLSVAGTGGCLDERG
mmetsp:Transcript_40407/g.101116  ORF Transcript_40407/g.101116 Transcript_40407/m.101116 type:complete len:360 (-) Transcript_40407:594-1673(-)